MPIDFAVPPDHHAALHAIQQIVYDAKPPTSAHLPRAMHRSEWRGAIIRRLFEFAETTDELIVVSDGCFSCTIYVMDVAYKLMTTRERNAPAHVVAKARLRTNRHRWLKPASTQLPLFGDAAAPGSDEMPVPLAFDPHGVLQVGWPDHVDHRGIGWGMVAAPTVAELPILTVVEPEAPAPEEAIPALVVPPLKKVDDSDT